MLVRSPGRLNPCRGLILDWRNLRPRRWEPQVMYFDDTAIQPTIRISWLNPAQLIPVPGDPDYDGPAIGER